MIESFSYCRILVLTLKTIFLLIVVVAIIGYIWYSDSLPFDFQNPVTLLSPTPEKIQQISNVITSSENEIIYYSFDDVPSIPDKQIPVDALKKAIEIVQYFMNHGIQVHLVNMDNKDPNEMGFDAITKLIKNTPSIDLAKLMELKLYAI